MYEAGKQERVRIPAVALKWDDWHDQEIVFLGLMCYIHNSQPKDELFVEYNMHPFDFYRVLHSQNQTHGNPGETLKRLQRMYRIGHIDSNNIYITPREDVFTPDTRQIKILSVETVVYTIEDQQAMRTYAYLAGRIAGNSNLVSDYEYRRKDEGVEDSSFKYTVKTMKCND